MSKASEVPTVLSPRQEALLESISTPLRRAVLYYLKEQGPMMRGHLQELTGVTQAAVRQTLDLFESLGVVVSDHPMGQRQGFRVYYDVDSAVVMEIIETLAAHLLPPEIVLRVSGVPLDQD